MAICAVNALIDISKSAVPKRGYAVEVDADIGWRAIDELSAAEVVIPRITRRSA
jgi:hypothetical protein